VISSPAVAGGTIYVGSTDGNLYAVDSEAGALKWKFEAKSRIACPIPGIAIFRRRSCGMQLFTSGAAMAMSTVVESAVTLTGNS
jgi:outer membrane protein assembly factor BamB